MKIAVVFIHGFTGGSSTWINCNNKAFKDLLAEDPAIVDAFDFFEFEYFTKISAVGHSAFAQKLLSLVDFFSGLPKRIGQIKKNQAIAHLSDQLTSYLRFNLSAYSQVLLVTHSMGGLIGKQYILSHEEGSGPSPVGYVSLAVPHKGSLSALLLAPTCNINAKELAPLSEYNDGLNNQWGHQKDRLPRSLYIVAQHDECVPKTSAIPFAISKKEKVVVDHDHTSICKPVDASDTSFLAVKSFLQDIAYAKSMVDTVAMAAESTTPDYDKEVFVIKMMVCDIGPQGIEDAKDCFFNAEMVSKAANKEDAIEMALMQKKVLSIYKQKYNSFHGTSKSSNQIFADIHAEITNQDSHALKSSVAYLNFLHKKGLLHQLANDFSKTVIWSSEPDYLEKISNAFA